jgi:hypothetical protein
MTEETRTLVRYRLGRAKEVLEEAVLLLESVIQTPLSTASTMPVSMRFQPYC